MSIAGLRAVARAVSVGTGLVVRFLLFDCHMMSLA
jgi:hypothetical protein